MIFNVWLALRDDAQEFIKARIQWDEELDGPYTGPVDDRTARFFRRVADLEGTQRLFKVASVGGRDYTLWSLYFNSKQFRMTTVKDEIDWLASQYPSRIIVTGAWNWDGEQVGTTHVTQTDIVNKLVSFFNPDYQPDPEQPDFDDRHVLRELRDVEVTTITGKTGTPMYPIHSRLIDFMPDGGLVDVNLLAGQSARSFF